LVDFNNIGPLLAKANARAVALSVDDRETTQNLYDGLRLNSLTVLHGADHQDLAERTGAYTDPERGILQATGFILSPGGAVAHAVYATGPIGRLTPLDTLRALDFAQRQG
jgi:alkyl hydroperoxide reductase subunit AhpC